MHQNIKVVGCFETRHWAEQLSRLTCKYSSDPLRIWEYWLTYSHTDRTASGSNFGFSTLPKDTLTSRLHGPGIKSSTFQSLDDPVHLLSHNHPLIKLLVRWYSGFKSDMTPYWEVKNNTDMLSNLSVCFLVASYTPNYNGLGLGWWWYDVHRGQKLAREA